jgi:U3 small nucleolar RNA-associated protein 21
VWVLHGALTLTKQWICDSLESPPRLLKFRSGHHASPHLIRYYGTDGKQLLTASQDRNLRLTSVVRDSRSFELSQGAGLAKKAAKQGLLQVEEIKLPPVTCLDWSTNRSKDWDDVLTGGQEETVARTWSVLNKRIGKYAFSTVPPVPPRPAKGDAKTKEPALPPGTVKSVCVTACGNFGLAGSSTGSIQLWNMQSGIRRKTFDVGPVPDEVDWRWREKGRGRGISGLATDSLNKWLVAGTVDGTLNVSPLRCPRLHSLTACH